MSLNRISYFEDEPNGKGFLKEMSARRRRREGRSIIEHDLREAEETRLEDEAAQWEGYEYDDWLDADLRREEADDREAAFWRNEEELYREELVSETL